MRAPWDTYFMNIARTVAERATCDRKHVGAVIVRDKTILSTGYNGSIRGMEHCDEAGHLMEDGHCIRTVHAEANAILQAAKNGTAIDGATLYSTASPCWPCFSLVANSGIRRIVFGDAYRAGDPGPKRVTEVAKLAGIELYSLAEEELARAKMAKTPELVMSAVMDSAIAEIYPERSGVAGLFVTCTNCGLVRSAGLSNCPDCQHGSPGSGRSSESR